MILSEGVRGRRGDQQSKRKASLASGAVAGLCATLVLGCIPATIPAPAEAQTQGIVPCPAQKQNLLVTPEIRSANGKLKATLKLVDGVRTLWDYAATNRCATQTLRILQGFDPANPTPWPADSAPRPGPTFRARVGDLVEIAFFNQINTNNFASTLDRGAVGTRPACDQYTGGITRDSSQAQFGQLKNDSMPNCLHGSSTTNVHFHGTHTTPSTTGDNILLLIRPAARINGQPQPSEQQANPIFAKYFAQCEVTGPAKRWTDMPNDWEILQRSLIQQYDSTAPYQGTPGALPDSSRMWPANQAAIDEGLWPQYHIGAVPYCFPLPAYNPGTMRMGQAPGTHWYHAHKHGSTAVNVANGLVGNFIIEGQYDDDLRSFYGPNLKQQVLMVQQLASVPFAMTNPATKGPGSVPRPTLSVNGRRNPLVAMRPNEVQLWRITNGAFRDAVNFIYFQPPGQTPCTTLKVPTDSLMRWRQIAQDGVQFNVANYGDVNESFNLAPANRADILVRAPSQTGQYTLCVQTNVAQFVQGKNGAPDSIPVALLTVNVTGSPVTPAMDFITADRFPAFPTFLSDIMPAEITSKRKLTFGPTHNLINNKSFQEDHVDQSMLLNTAEEWIIQNQANDKAHPFHIHINPFQIIEVFQPNDPANKVPGSKCYVDITDPKTFDPDSMSSQRRNDCAKVPSPWIWWDTFGIPTGIQQGVTCTPLSACPANLQQYIACRTNSKGAVVCTETVPGWFRMRSRFMDFTGQYVLHCHILIHEDRGMMQLIEVVSDKSPYIHH